jgi:hypothetical protein
MNMGRQCSATPGSPDAACQNSKQYVVRTGTSRIF